MRYDLMYRSDPRSSATAEGIFPLFSGDLKSGPVRRLQSIQMSRPRKLSQVLARDP